MWNFHDFSITQILREIKFGNSRSATFAISTHLKALYFDLYEILHFLKVDIYPFYKIQSPKNGINSSFVSSTVSHNWFHVKSKSWKNPEILREIKSQICLRPSKCQFHVKLEHLIFRPSFWDTSYGATWRTHWQRA